MYSHLEAKRLDGALGGSKILLTMRNGAFNITSKLQHLIPNGLQRTMPDASHIARSLLIQETQFTALLQCCSRWGDAGAFWPAASDTDPDGEAAIAEAQAIPMLSCQSSGQHPPVHVAGGTTVSARSGSCAATEGPSLQDSSMPTAGACEPCIMADHPATALNTTNNGAGPVPSSHNTIPELIRPVRLPKPTASLLYELD